MSDKDSDHILDKASVASAKINQTNIQRKIEYYQAANKLWYWRVRAASNGKVTQTGAEGYVSKGNVLRAIAKESSFWNKNYYSNPMQTK